MEASKVVWGIALFAALAVPAKAQEPVRIGLITTLSGPGGYIGADILYAFQLAVEQEGSKLGGVPVQVIVEDDGFKPGQGKQIAEKSLKTEKIKLFTGIVFSNIAGATVPDILDAGAIYVSPNAAPSNLPARNATRTITSCHGKIIRCMRVRVRMRPTSATSKLTSWRRTIRPGRMHSPASSVSSKALSSARPIRASIRPISRRRWPRFAGREAGNGVSIRTRRSRHCIPTAISAGRTAGNHPDGGGLSVD